MAVGGRVNYTLTLTNNTSQTITFQTLGVDAPVNGSLRVVDASNRVIYPGTTDTISRELSGNLTLAAGQSLTETITTGNVFTTTGQDTATAYFAVYTSPTAANLTTVGPLAVMVQ